MVRFKNRYLVVEIAHNDGRAMEERGKERAVLDTLRESLRENFGDVGLGRALGALSVRYVDAMTGVCVVRCGREVAREVRGAIATIQEMRGRRAAAAVTHCGGAVRGVREASGDAGVGVGGAREVEGGTCGCVGRDATSGDTVGGVQLSRVSSFEFRRVILCKSSTDACVSLSFQRCVVSSRSCAKSVVHARVMMG